jgi:hypothetical protein
VDVNGGGMNESPASVEPGFASVRYIRYIYVAAQLFSFMLMWYLRTTPNPPSLFFFFGVAPGELCRTGLGPAGHHHFLLCEHVPGVSRRVCGTVRYSVRKINYNLNPLKRVEGF